MSQMNEIQIGVAKEDYFLQEIQALGQRQFFRKFYCILATTELGDNFAAVACHLFLWIGTTFDFFQLFGKVPVCKQFLKIIERGFTIVESHIFNNLIDMSS